LTNKKFIKYVKKHINLPSNTYGSLDWISGLLILNITDKEYEYFINNINSNNNLLETITHEMFHVYQICTCAYLYYSMAEISHEIMENIFNIDNVKLTDLFSQNLNITNKASKWIAELEGNKSYGYSILDIIEGYAFYSHHRMTNKNINSENYLSILKNYPTIYSNLYMFLLNKIGSKKAFLLYPCLAYLSLQFKEPCEIFSYLTKIIIVENIKVKKETIDTFNFLYMKVSDYALNNNKLIMPPNYIYTQYGYDSLHPFYNFSIKKMYDKYNSNEINSFMCMPQLIPQEFRLNMYRPILLNTGYIVSPKDFDKGIFDSISENETYMVTIASLFFKLFKFKNNELTFQIRI